MVACAQPIACSQERVQGVSVLLVEQGGEEPAAGKCLGKDLHEWLKLIAHFPRSEWTSRGKRFSQR